jgi:hypothetical protein
MSVSPEELTASVLSPIHQALDNEGITAEKLAKLAKAELNAKITKTVKVKGAIGGRKLPRGYKEVVSTGIIEESEDGNFFGTGDTLIESRETNWTIRQKARMDIHKLRGDYPADKHEVKFNEESLNAVFKGLPEEFREAVRAELEAALPKRRN